MQNRTFEELKVVVGQFASHEKHEQHTALVSDVIRLALDDACPQLLPLLGPSRVGKSEVLKKTFQAHPPHRTCGRMRTPVLHLSLKPGASAKTLPSDILCALDSPVSMRGTTASQLNALMEKQLQLAGTKVLLLDEANHLTDEGKRITLRAAADWLKCLMDGLGISIVLSGIPRLNALLESNEQLYLRARPASYYMPYDASQEADYNAFAALIWEYMSRFQNVGYPIEINDEEFIADCLMFSGGLVGVVHKFFVNLLHVLKGAKPRGVTLEDSQRALAMTATLAPENCTAFGQKAADPVRQRLVYARVLKANAMPEPTLF